MVQTRSGVNRNLWRRRQSGLFAPDRTLFPSSNLVTYLPLWHPEKSGSPYDAWNVEEESVISCVNTGAVHDPPIGRTFDGIDDNVEWATPFPDASFNNIAFSIAIWFYPTSDKRFQGVATFKCRNQFASVTWNSFYLVFDGSSNNGYVRLSWNRYTGTSTDRTPLYVAELFDLNQWLCVVVTYDGSGTPSASTVTCDINGVSKTISGTAFSLLLTDQDYLTVRLGGADTVNDRYFVGKIGECILYDAVVPPDDRLNIYNSLKWRYS